MFSMARSKPHSSRKRVVSNMYSKSYLQSSSEMHRISRLMLFKRLLPLLEKAAVNNEPLDVLELNFACMMDFVMAYIFGSANGTKFIEDVKSRQWWLNTFQSRRPFSFWDAELPTLKTMLKRLGLPVVPSWVASASRDLEAWTLRYCKAAETSEAESKTESSTETGSDTIPVVYRQMHDSIHAESNSSPYPKELQIATELHDHLAAAHETSGITLTYLFHELSLNPSLQASLRTELLTLSPTLEYHHHHPSSSQSEESDPEIPSPRDIDNLPLLHACIMETLRLHSAIPGPQPRITPFPPQSLAGCSTPLPPGVRVSAQAYSLHRNATVFPDPEVWKPARWLDGSSDERKAEMARWFWAFGSGGRMCVGRHFAMQGQSIPLIKTRPSFFLLSI